MRFLPDPDPPASPTRELPNWRWTLYASAALAAIASSRPWVQVRFTRLFGELLGPPAWQGSAGFTCLTTSMLVLVMTMAETNSKVSQNAVRPASLLLVVVASLSLVLQWSQGPGSLRGVTAMWTLAFYLALVSVPTLLLACSMRQHWSRRAEGRAV